MRIFLPPSQLGDLSVYPPPPPLLLILTSRVRVVCIMAVSINAHGGYDRFLLLPKMFFLLRGARRNSRSFSVRSSAYDECSNAAQILLLLSYCITAFSGIGVLVQQYLRTYNMCTTVHAWTVVHVRMQLQRRSAVFGLILSALSQVTGQKSLLLGRLDNSGPWKKKADQALFGADFVFTYI